MVFDKIEATLEFEPTPNYFVTPWLTVHAGSDTAAI